MTSVFFNVGPKWQWGRSDKGPRCLGAEMVVRPKCLNTKYIDDLNLQICQTHMRYGSRITMNPEN